MEASRFKMENHVENAFAIASELAKGEPINAKNALQAVIFLNRNKAA